MLQAAYPLRYSSRGPAFASGALFLSALIMGASCYAAKEAVKPFETPDDVERISKKESRLWIEAENIDEAIQDSDQIYESEAVEQYLQEIMARLYPGFQYTIKVRTLKSPILNAFALPNGSIYINAGLLARLDNEAQLATVLAHEVAHFANRHSLRQRRVVKSRSALAVGTAIAGIPLADLIAISSIFGFSRDLEREADVVGYERLEAVGYDVRESVRVFEHLHAEAKVLDEKHPVFFSSHPKLKERIESFKKLVALSAQTKGHVGREEYLQRTRRVRLAALEADLSMDRYKSLILVLEDNSASQRYEPHIRNYYLGEAYRRRGGEGDTEKAEAAYRKAIELRSDFAPSYRALGILYLKKDDSQKARPLLEKYLELAPDAPDRAYVEHYMNSL